MVGRAGLFGGCMTQREPGSAAFSIGEGAHLGNIHVGGSVAGRDVTIGIAPSDAATAADRTELLALLKRVEAAVAALDEAPSGLKSDAQDELRKASEAGASGDDSRLTGGPRVAGRTDALCPVTAYG
jgi:hypothetical protein